MKKWMRRGCGRAEAENSDNADVKQWAANTLPALKQHLERAKQIQENLKNTR